MPNTTPLQLDDQGVLGLLRDFEALRSWEVLRSARTAVTVEELDQATGLEQTIALAGFYHCLADSVFHTEERIEKFRLHADFSF